MAHIPEGRHVFTRMSVEENLEMGAFSLKDQSSLKRDLDMVYGLFPRLKERRNQKPAHCPAASSKCSRWAAR